MKNLSLLSLLLVLFPFSIVPAQENKPPQSLSETFINHPSDKKLSMGMYGHVDFSKPLDDSLRKNGKLDVTRLVMLVNYKFSDKLDFFSEVEFEHVKELWVEQAFLQYRFSDALMLKGGLMVIPMGIVNEYHEPTTYNGVKRPSIDTRIVPTTWREIGFGLSGNLSQAYLKYQIYLVNGFKSYDGTANLGGPNGFRSGRQRGAESFISSPNLSAKVDFYVISGLNIGLAGYFGNTQSTLYQDLQKDDKALNDRADSSVVNLAMLGVDARYTLGGLQLRGQYILNMIGNTAAYNSLTGKDLGSRMGGWYAEAAWNLLHGSEAAGRPLTLFARIEQYDLHAATENGLARNKAYNMTEITTGLGYSIAEGAVIKADVQLISDKIESAFHPTINAGIGFNF